MGLVSLPGTSQARQKSSLRKSDCQQLPLALIMYALVWKGMSLVTMPRSQQREVNSVYGKVYPCESSINKSWLIIITHSRWLFYIIRAPRQNSFLTQ
jgi:hypothetical protein